jgi:sortase B
MQKKRKTKIKWKNIIIILTFGISINCISFSIYQILNWNKDNQNTEKIMERIDIDSVIEEKSDGKTLETPVEIPKENPYWDFIKMNLINVNFKSLKETNPDTIGWIKINGTNINYPIVKTSNNEFYLNHSFDKSKNNAGWVFMDYRNNINNFDQNTLLYAHGRFDGTMFGTLRNIFTNGWLETPNNFVIKMSNERENTMWQVFSVYKIPTTNDYLRINFKHIENYENFLKMITDRSNHAFNTPVSKTDRILTLSTCYDDYEKVVVHAKLIKQEKKSL